MAKRKISKTRKKRLIVFGTLSMVIIGSFLFTLFFSFYELYHLKKAYRQYDESLLELKRDEKILSSEIDKLQDEEYIAKYARENYSYSKDGEYIIKLTDKEETENKEKSNWLDFDYNYFIYIGAGSILLILVYAIKKKK